MKKRIANWVLFLLTLTLSLFAGEIILRTTLGGSIRVWDFSTPFFINTVKIIPDLDSLVTDFSKKYFMDTALYRVNPALRTYGTFRKESALIAPHTTTIMWHEMLKQWNYNYLKKSHTADPHFYNNDMFRWYDNAEVYAFNGYDSSEYPVFRYFTNSMSNLPECKTRFNNFGWGGSDIQLQKPANTIRIAFLGASTTMQTNECDFAYPDYIEAWLDEWSKNKKLGIDFEIINTARLGQTSSDLASIYKYELQPAQPDIVVYYEGRNQFSPPVNCSQPQTIGLFTRAFLALYVRSALLQRVLCVLQIHPYHLFEKHKCPEEKTLPADEDPYRQALPLCLNQIVNDLDTIRINMDTSRQYFMLCSYTMILEDSVLSAPAYTAIYNSWNADFKNVPVRELKRMSAFQNKLFKKYAHMHNIYFCDVAAELSHYPYFFFDGIHLECRAKKLQAWIVFKDLIPLVESKIKEGKLPNYIQNPYSAHPYIRENAFLVNLKNLNPVKPMTSSDR